MKGNIYCNAAGARNWYDGEKTDFTIDDGAMKCESDGNSIILVYVALNHSKDYSLIPVSTLPIPWIIP